MVTHSFVMISTIMTKRILRKVQVQFLACHKYRKKLALCFHEWIPTDSYHNSTMKDALLCGRSHIQLH